MSSRDNGIEDVIQIGVGLALLVFLLYLIIVVGSATLIIAPPVIGFLWWYNKRKHETHLQTLTDDTTSLHERVTKLRATFFSVSEDDLANCPLGILELNAQERGIERVPTDFDDTLTAVFADLYHNYAIPPMPELTGNFAGVDPPCKRSYCQKETRMTSVLDKIKELDKQRDKLLKQAKKVAHDKATNAVEELNSLGFHYELVERKSSSSGNVSRQSVRKRKDVPCPLCNFKTTPPHDGRAHRSQTSKAPFTEKELRERGLSRVS